MKAKDTGPSSAAVLKRPKKSKHGKLSTQAVQLENIDQSPEKSKKKKANARERPEQHDISQKRGKKRKKIDAEGQGESKTQSEYEGESGPPKKKHKNRTNFADPREDTQLNTQSRKALEYVFTQMNHPSRWKFNKARQNWIMRNVWSSETVPEIYFPLVLRYLANVQGGCREKLKETCQSYLTDKAILIEAPPSTPLGEADTVKLVKPTRGLLISPSSQPTPGAIVPTAAITSPPIPISDPAASMKRTRAQSLLDALT